MYTLMHKDIPVITIDITDNKMKVIKVINESQLPIGGQMNSMKLHEWWQDRAVPKTRKGSKHALRELGLASTDNMLLSGLALSLNDCYWINPVGSSFEWKDVSLFRNNFIDIFGELTFDTTKSLSRFKDQSSFRLATSQGELQKKWCIDANGRRFLVKGNWGESYQQSLNEIFASRIHQLQGWSLYVHYHLCDIDVEGNRKGIGCACYNFCSEDIESVSAWEIMQSVKLRASDSYFNTFKKACVLKYGMNEDYFDRYISYLLMTDFLMSNTDRHMNNIALLRDANTLKVIGFSPIYDTGNSMFFRCMDIPTGNLLKIETHSFLKSEVKMLQYVKYRNILDLSKLPSDAEFISIYMRDIPSRHFRIEQMLKAWHSKINYLRRFQNGEDIWK